MRETVRRYVGRRAAQVGCGYYHRAFRYHVQSLFEISGSYRAFHPAAARDQRIGAPLPVDRVCRIGDEQREQPVRLGDRRRLGPEAGGIEILSGLGGGRLRKDEVRQRTLDELGRTAPSPAARALAA